MITHIACFVVGSWFGALVISWIQTGREYRREVKESIERMGGHF